jgi:hypothetical protein
MFRISLVGLIFVLGVNISLHGQGEFKIVWNFDDNLLPVTENTLGAVYADSVVYGGDNLSTVSLQNISGTTVLQSTITNNRFADYKGAYIKVNFGVQQGYYLLINTIRVRQKNQGSTGNSFTRVGMTLNGSTPEIGNTDESSDSLPLRTSFTNYDFYPSPAYQKITNQHQPTLFVTGRTNPGFSYQWQIDRIEVMGVIVDESVIHNITVTNQVKQQMRYGIDAERLWFWYSQHREVLANYAAGELKSDFVRVAVNCEYEKTEGVKNLAAYDKILDMMNAIKDVNPDIAFFASPRPLAEAYTKAEAETEWGHKDNIPWAPYPRWILQWNQSGTVTMDDGTVAPRWVQGSFNVTKLVQYYADYLNLMHEKGFKITYLDVTNEKNVITPAINKAIFDALPAKLNPGVHMPAFIVPSTWSREQGTTWLKSVNRNLGQDKAFEIAGTHNTDLAGTAEAFVAEARKLGKEVWNTELHGWVGITPDEEIMTSEHLWEHIRAGFSGIDTWLFYGPYNGKDHTMIWSNSSEVRTSVKYEIFKQLVNTSNRGYYIATNPPAETPFPVASFIKDSVLTVWALNSSENNLFNVKINFDEWDVANKKVWVTRWNASLDKRGITTSLNSDNTGIIEHNIRAKSLYLFNIDLRSDVTSVKAVQKTNLRLSPNPTTGMVYISGINENYRYEIIDLQGKTIGSGITDGASSIDMSNEKSGVYILKVFTPRETLTSRIILTK